MNRATSAVLPCLGGAVEVRPCVANGLGADKTGAVSWNRVWPFLGGWEVPATEA